MTISDRTANAPSPPRGVLLLDRPALFGLLDAGAATQVTVVTAPAGSGKTVLARSWLSARGLTDQTAWVSVERGERDPQRFWAALAAEVSRAGSLAERMDTVALSPTFNAQVLTTRLVSRLTELELGLMIVIDDVHEIQSAELVSQLSQFLDQLPTTVRVVLISRHDPQLGLHRRRLVGDVTEIRIDELRFTLEESGQLLASSGVTLSEDGLRLLHSRTEGWAAGLRLAAVSLAAHPDPERFVPGILWE